LPKMFIFYNFKKRFKIKKNETFLISLLKTCI